MSSKPNKKQIDDEDEALMKEFNQSGEAPSPIQKKISEEEDEDQMFRINFDSSSSGDEDEGKEERYSKEAVEGMMADAADLITSSLQMGKKKGKGDEVKDDEEKGDEEKGDEEKDEEDKSKTEEKGKTEEKTLEEDNDSTKAASNEADSKTEMSDSPNEKDEGQTTTTSSPPETPPVHKNTQHKLTATTSKSSSQPPRENNTQTSKPLFRITDSSLSDDFVRKGSCLRNLIGMTVRTAVSSILAKRITDYKMLQNDDEDEYSILDEEVNEKKRRAQDEPLPKRNRRRKEYHTEYAAELAREKAAECMVLQRTLKESQSQCTTLSTTLTSIRTTHSQTTDRLNRTVEALRIAGQNTANARADADAAEAKARNLAHQLQSTREVMEEIKQACSHVKLEHDEIANASRSVEARCLTMDAELGRADREKQRLEDERDELKEKFESLEREKRMFREDLDQVKSELSRAKKMAEEREAIERARADRMMRLENELKDARATLVEATGTTAESESTLAALNDTISELQKENQGLHEKIEDILNTSKKERERLDDALSSSESEAQRLRIKSAQDEDEIQKLKLDVASGEKQITQLKNRISNLERRLAEATTSSISGNDNGSISSSSIFARKSLGAMSSGKGGTPISIPPLRSTLRSPKPSGRNNDIETPTSAFIFGSRTGTRTPLSSITNKNNTTNSKNCCVCSKPPFGLMKSCQCGEPNCDKKAHASCLASQVKKALPSVSHPRTTASNLSSVLCDKDQGGK